VPVRNSGVASAFNNAVSRVGPQLAGALLFIAITSTFYGGLSERLPGVDVSSDRLREQVTPLNAPDPDVPPDVTAAAGDASTEAFHTAMLAAALMCAAGAAVNAVGIKDRQRVAGEEHGDVVAPAAQSPCVEVPTSHA